MKSNCTAEAWGMRSATRRKVNVLVIVFENFDWNVTNRIELEMRR